MPSARASGGSGFRSACFGLLARFNALTQSDFNGPRCLTDRVVSRLNALVAHRADCPGLDFPGSFDAHLACSAALIVNGYGMVAYSGVVRCHRILPLIFSLIQF